MNCFKLLAVYLIGLNLAKGTKPSRFHAPKQAFGSEAELAKRRRRISGSLEALAEDTAEAEAEKDHPVSSGLNLRKPRSFRKKLTDSVVWKKGKLETIPEEQFEEDTTD